jgi:hypothetical protein
MFDINFITNKSSPGSETPIALAEIHLGDFREQFEVSLEYWSKGQYQRQWLEGITRIINGDSKSCLITSIYNPKYANFLCWWTLYRNYDRCYVHNGILFLEGIKQIFDINKIYNYIETRITVNEDGDMISEWSLPIADLEVWWKTQNQETY